MAWTDERVDQLKTLWIGGASASQIAKELGGVTRNAVIGKVHRLGLSSRNQGKPEAAVEKPAAKPEAPVVEEVAAAPEPATATVREVETPEPEATTAAASAEETKAASSDADVPSTVSAPGGMVTIPSENQVDISEIDREARKLSLMDLTERTCKWPIGDPSRGEFYFCGHPVVAGKPYCKGHTAAAYQPMSSRRDRDRARTIQRPAITRSA